MNQRKLLLQLLPGFIPLFIFIIADEIWGTTVGLVVAVASGVLELAFYWFREKRFDKFVLLDTLLIIFLGVISIILDNEMFFMIKPGLIGVLMSVFLGVSAYTPANLMFSMSKRYMKGIEFTDHQMAMMKRNIKVLFWIFTGYTALVFYATWYMSKEAWGFISGVLLYLLFGGWFLFELLRNRLKGRMSAQEEWLPLLNEKGEVIGKAPRSVCHSSKSYLHPVVHLHVINSRGEIFLQRRAMYKIQPGRWDTAVGGHISFGEKLEDALQRETREEIGITEFNAQLTGTYIWESDIEREYVFSFITRYDGPFKTNPEELMGGRFWSVKEIRESLGKGIFTPNFEDEFKRIVKLV